MVAVWQDSFSRVHFAFKLSGLGVTVCAGRVCVVKMSWHQRLGMPSACLCSVRGVKVGRADTVNTRMSRGCSAFWNKLPVGT